MPLCHTCACTYVIQLSDMPGLLCPWINGMTKVVQFASVSSMSDILPTYICTLAHTYTISHYNRLTADMYYTHTCAYIYAQCNAPSHSRKVYSTLLIFPFLCTMGSRVSAAFGGSALVGKMLFWQGRLLWQLTR